MSPPKRKLTHLAAPARPRPNLEELMGLQQPAPAEPDPAERTSAPQDPEPAFRSAPPAARSRAAEGPAAEEDPYVLYSVQIKRSTYLRLKRVEYWEPGFQQRQHVNQAINKHLDELKHSDRQLPPDEQRKLLNSKKLRG